MIQAFVNGELSLKSTARIAIDDRGFRFGDGVFETLRLHRGVPYLWEYHMERLQTGLTATRIATPIWDIQTSAKAVITANAPEGFLRLAISRGVGSEGYMPTASHSSLVIEYLPQAEPSPPVNLWVSPLYRPSASIKTAQGLASTLALLEARDHSCDNALLLTPDGYISECANANIIWLTNGMFYTPSLSTGCVAGVTRRRLMEFVEITEIEAPPTALDTAQAVYICNTKLGLHAVLQLGSHILGPHPTLEALAQKIREDRDHYSDSHRDTWS